MDLNLHDGPPSQQAFNAGISVDNMTWWFWVKAGMGFMIGAGVVYVSFSVVWFWLLTQAPGLIVLRALTRF